MKIHRPILSQARPFVERCPGQNNFFFKLGGLVLQTGKAIQFFNHSYSPITKSPLITTATGFIKVNAALERLRKAGAKLEAVKFPSLEALNAAASITLLVEAGSFFGPYLAQKERLGEDIRQRFAQGLLVSAVDWVNAQRLRALWKRQVAELFTECDLLLTPGSPVVAPRIYMPFSELGGQRVDARTAVSQYLRSFNFLGLPALSLPCGLDEQGLPVGLQMVGPAFADRWLLRAGILAEEVLAFEAKPALALR